LSIPSPEEKDSHWSRKPLVRAMDLLYSDTGKVDHNLHNTLNIWDFYTDRP